MNRNNLAEKTKKELSLILATRDINNLISKGTIDFSIRKEAIKKFADIHKRSSKNILVMKVEKNIISFTI